ncbi:hypothetical protein JCM19231_2548 [Vibrio ishigakensis]|uniref:Uncharacterized protein n=1 Tax=Vibrio ishigakensis TaxID=1481914 RepID=A0A0B8NVW6_9VIBR|nr:hypothetical protein JCM19231_2548 [Vibrio ishigakensis]
MTLAVRLEQGWYVGFAQMEYLAARLCLYFDIRWHRLAAGA